MPNLTATMSCRIFMLMALTTGASAQPMGAGAPSGVVYLLLVALPFFAVVVALWPWIYLSRRAKAQPAAALRPTVPALIAVFFLLVAAGFTALAVDLATPKEIDMGSEFFMSDVSWLHVTAAGCSVIIALAVVVKAGLVMRQKR